MASKAYIAIDLKSFYASVECVDRGLDPLDTNLVVADPTRTGDTLNAILNQRSQDMLTANNWNVCQYAALLIMFAKASGLKAGELVHVIADAHIYDRHIDAVKRIIEKEPYPAPEMVVEDITDFYKFTKNSFTLKDYKYHDFDEKIEVAI